MDYTLIETFILLSRTLNLTKTAEILFVSQSTVSNRLKNIENETGAILIDRDRGFKEIELTPEGKEFLEIALEYEQLNDKMNNLRTNPFKKLISVGTIASINNFLLNNLYKDLIKDSNLQLEIKTEHTEEIYRQVVSRVIDVGFITRYIAYPQINYSELAEEVMVIVTKSKSTIKFLEPKDLNPQKQIFFNWGDQYIHWHNKHFSYQDKPKIMLDSQILAIDFLEKDSWFIAPTSVANKLETLFDDIQISLFKDNPPLRKIYMITHKKPLKSNLDIIDEIKSTVENHLAE